MGNQYEMTNQYNVTYNISGRDYNSTDNKLAWETVVAKVTFSHDPDTYGNGYHMGIKSKVEQFGFQGYDLRYDRTFSPERIISWLAKYFENRYDGKDGRWKLFGISIEEE